MNIDSNCFGKLILRPNLSTPHGWESLKRLRLNINRGLSKEDKIVLFRFTVGAVYGLVVLALSTIVDRVELSIYSWSVSVLIYYVTIAYIALKYKPDSRFQLYIRGLGTFYATWLLTSIVLYEVLVYLGIKD